MGVGNIVPDVYKPYHIPFKFDLLTTSLINTDAI